MRRMNLKKTVTSLFVVVFTLFTVFGASAQKGIQEKYLVSDLEKLEDENMDYLNQIYRIVKDYPAFSFSYTIDEGKIQDVVVEGVDNNMDRKRLEVALFDLESNKNMMKNKANRIGVFYSVDDKAKYENGWESLKNDVLSNIDYSERIKQWGLEGTIFVKFVVDEDGEIPYLTTSTNMENSDIYVEKLEQEAVNAVKATSGDWIPSEVEGEEVASLVVLPITFDIKKAPFLPAMIY